MMVTFVSECEKKALPKTRRVLDAFANRVGTRTWQTVITNEGLAAVKKLLRKTASKNTAVSCHWIRSRSRSELVWIVGNRNRFNLQGSVPVNRTGSAAINNQWENDWHYLPLIKALTALAALFHDVGKSSELFQEKLKPGKSKNFKGDPIRHEWVSCLLFNAIVQINSQGASQASDRCWLAALTKGDLKEREIIELAEKQEIRPLSQLPPIAQLVAWLIVSHHRLPLLTGERANAVKADQAETIGAVLDKLTKEWGYENRYEEAEYQRRLKQCFNFPRGLLSESKKWLSEVQKWAKRLTDCEALVKTAIDNGSYRQILSYARLCLMLGDHYYSSQDAVKNWRYTTGLFANTDRETHELKQKLDEHLYGVTKQSLRNSHLLPSFEAEPPSAMDIKALKRASPAAYRWQDKAVEKIKKYRSDFPERQGFFVVNMASTGCGKTFANAKVMRALSQDFESLRFVLALGLRTLTLQTGDEYRERVGLDNSELAVVIGSQAVMELNKQRLADEEIGSYERSGSTSEEQLIDEEVDFDCNIPEEGLATVLSTERDRKFLYAPVLACTIDHMMAATETKRGGRFILPTLRLMSSDLVIDEIDDFTGDDLIAIGRLIHLAGMLGRKVMISSATIPPDLAEGYFKAYRDGWEIFCKTRDATFRIACVWIDEFGTQVVSNSAIELKKAIPEYRNSHTSFINKRVKKLLGEPVKRIASISSCEGVFSGYPGSHCDQEVVASQQEAYFSIIINSAIKLHHSNNTVDEQSQCHVSFGVCRVANIQPCVALAKYLLNVQLPEEVDIRVMAYHSQQVLLLRHNQEQHLDRILKRKEGFSEQPQAYSDPQIRRQLQVIKPTAKHMIFILVATPVEEVGRDHDFDWAVIEPSSYRSIVQLAGRVLRHRTSVIVEPNIHILQYNWNGIKNKHRVDCKVFLRPGFEEKVTLESHDMNDLIDVEKVAQRLDAIPRIRKAVPLQPTKQLADLEHHATRELLATYRKTASNGKFPQVGPAKLQGYLREAWFLTALPQQLTPFRKSDPVTKLFLVFDEHDECFEFCEKNDRGFPVKRESVFGISRFALSDREQLRLWLPRDFPISLNQQSDRIGKSQRATSMRYGEINFRHSDKKRYGYNDDLGIFEL